jgi:ABC-type phosphate/phosphonate transport system permease subunit
MRIHQLASIYKVNTLPMNQPNQEMREFGIGEEYFSPLYEPSQLDYNYSLTSRNGGFFGSSLQTLYSSFFSSLLSSLFSFYLLLQYFEKGL